MLFLVRAVPQEDVVSRDGVLHGLVTASPEGSNGMLCTARGQPR
jgi:hypothetical protein